MPETKNMGAQSPNSDRSEWLAPTRQAVRSFRESAKPTSGLSAEARRAAHRMASAYEALLRYEDPDETL